MEIRGEIWTIALMALFAVFMVEVAKRAMKARLTEEQFNEYSSYIPLPLAILCVAVGVGLAALSAPGFEEVTLVQGGSAGFVAAAFAAFGYDFVSGILKQRAR